MIRIDDYKGIWILAEQHEGRLLRISFELITRGLDIARKRNSKLCAIVFSAGISDDELNKLILCGCDKVISVEAPRLKNFLTEPYSKAMPDLISKYKPELILAGATSTGRTLMPYAAMKAYCGITADCTQLDIEEKTGNLLQTRPAIGGNIMATIKTPNHRPQMATIRPRSTIPAASYLHRGMAKSLDSESLARSNISPECRPPRQSSLSIMIQKRRFSKSPISASSETFSKCSQTSSASSRLARAELSEKERFPIV